MSWQTEVSKSKSDELFDHLPVTLPAWQAYTPQELQTLGGYFTVLHFQHPGEVALVQDQLVSFVAVILQGNMKVVMRPTGDKKTSSSKSLLNDPNNPPDIKSSSSSLPQVKKDSDLRFDVGIVTNKNSFLFLFFSLSCLSLHTIHTLNTFIKLPHFTRNNIKSSLIILYS